MSEIIQSVPIYLKPTLSIREAAEYSGIGINTIESLLRDPRCPFLILIGTKKMVRRTKFDEYLENTSFIPRFVQ